jgi:hypothetical protein
MRKFLLLALLLAACRPASDGDDRLFYDRLWIDHIPQNERDTANVLIALDELADKPVGAFLSASSWRGSFENFIYQRGERGRLRVLYPQDRKSDKIVVHARECREKGFDYCLEVRGASFGVKRYYSLREWEMRSLDGVLEFLRHDRRISAGWQREAQL